MLRNIRGMRDISGEEARKFHFLETKAREIFQRYGFAEIRTPILEHTDLFLRGVGEETDIVSKEMYTLEDRKEQNLVLRPEGTAPIVRHAILENLLKRQEIQKFFYSGPMFRYERPQKGRYRQFHQIGGEFFGEASIYGDLEIILMLNHYFKEIGIKQRTFEINSIGSLEDREKYKKTLREFLLPSRDQLCELCQNRFEKNSMRILDCKNPECRKLTENIPEISDSISSDKKAEFKKLQSLLKSHSVDFRVNPRLVRGLDYYSDMVFEIYSEHLGAQSALGGGGRYDGLFEIFGAEKCGATGFGLGLDRLALMLDLPEKEKPMFFVVGNDLDQNLLLAEQLRNSGLRAETNFAGKALKSQFKQADRRNATYTLILGEEEIQNSSVSIKEMQSGRQNRMERDRLIESCRRLSENPKETDLFS